MRPNKACKPLGSTKMIAMSINPYASCEIPAPLADKVLLKTSSNGSKKQAPIKGPHTVPIPPIIHIKATRIEMLTNENIESGSKKKLN